MKRKISGPGRPRKYGEDLKRFQAYFPESLYDWLWEMKEKLNVSFADLFLFFKELMEKNIEKLELQAKIKHLEEALAQERREKQALLEEREKLLDRIEKLQLKIQQLEQGSKESRELYREMEKFREIAKHAQEGVTWKEACAKIGIVKEKIMRKLLEDGFIVKRDEHDKLPMILKPKNHIKKVFEGFVLVRPFENSLLEDAVFVPEEKAEAFLKEQKLKAESEKALEVSDIAAEITKVLREWLESYELVLTDRHGKERAERMAKDFQRFALKRLIDKYGFTAVFDVVYSDPHFKRVILPLLEFYAPKEEKEVVAE